MKLISAIFAIFGFASISSAQMTIKGTGSVPVSPDNAIVNVVVTTFGDRKVSINENNKVISDLTESIKKKFKIDSKDICTENFHVSPRYERLKDGNDGKLLGYNVVNNFSVTIKDIKAAGDVLNDISSFEAPKSTTIRTNNFDFVVSDQLRSSVENQARVLAVKDAKSKAILYAETAGAKLGGVLSINEGNVYVPRYGAAPGSRMLAESSVPVSSGTTKVSVSVNIVYKIN